MNYQNTQDISEVIRKVNLRLRSPNVPRPNIPIFPPPPPLKPRGSVIKKKQLVGGFGNPFYKPSPE